MVPHSMSVSKPNFGSKSRFSDGERLIKHSGLGYVQTMSFEEFEFIRVAASLTSLEPQELALIGVAPRVCRKAIGVAEFSLHDCRKCSKRHFIGNDHRRRAHEISNAMSIRITIDRRKLRDAR